MKKIALNLLPFTERLTGTGFYTKRLIAELQQLPAEYEFELHVYNLDNANDVFAISDPAFKVVSHHFIRNRMGRIFYEQCIFPFKIKADILVSTSVVLPLLLPHHIKKVSVIHDLIPFIFKQKYGLIQGAYVKLFTKWSARMADIVITISENSQKDIIQRLGVAASRIRIVYNFVPEENEKTPATIPTITGPFIITVSTIQPGKNLIRLFEAFQPIAQEKGLKLVVVGGKGWKYDNIFAKVNELNLSEHIIFTGYVSDEQLRGYYQHALGLVYVSLYEGFGIPPLEAMIRKCPVVVSNNSSLPEVVGKAGIYVNPESVENIREGILQLFDEAVVNEKKQYMAAEVAKFDRQREAEKFLKIMKAL
ncbi:glycosyltransferase family 4 protein [Chitinophaga sancti]|uniref:Glycosyltransferase family 1 protein n=1 Tax=Chitinophaga sancti TaxID=1004 RepID=A0A1K1RK99_9BACT|nr:glycosyltransferase family 1 protein [Chitinophaga sancti]WQD60757.1 glycosyltransferase family 1 protein [Chitinophaga sancti]WQG87115.1 glycosyltransferase family 1 protein [Chitinophaga sancti]SFW72353.1 Glycosyltransferase involved in cell wall bisynthesis [Chitinophaga sancti]